MEIEIKGLAFMFMKNRKGTGYMHESNARSLNVILTPLLLGFLFGLYLWQEVISKEIEVHLVEIIVYIIFSSALTAATTVYVRKWAGNGSLFLFVFLSVLLVGYWILSLYDSLRYKPGIETDVVRYLGLVTALAVAYTSIRRVVEKIVKRFCSGTGSG